MHEYTNERLVVGEPEALVISAHYVVGFGWAVKISVRRQFQLWPEAATSSYEGLTTEELVGVVEANVAWELLG